MGSSPGWIQGVQIVDGKVREIYREIGKDFADRRIEERKRLIFLALHRKPIKPRDKELALFTEAIGALPVS